MSKYLTRNVKLHFLSPLTDVYFVFETSCSPSPAQLESRTGYCSCFSSTRHKICCRVQTICDDQFSQKRSDTFRHHLLFLFFVLFFVEWISTNSAEYFEVVETNKRPKLLILAQGTAPPEVSEVSKVSERVFEVVSDLWLCWRQRSRRTRARAHLLLPKTNLPERHQLVLSAAAPAALAPPAAAVALVVAAPVALFTRFSLFFYT